MAKATPAFQFYPADFLVGTAHLDMECCGAYLHLLLYQWTQNSLPNDTDVLAGYCRMTPQKFARVWKRIQDKFVEDDNGNLINERMEEVRDLQQKRKRSGAKGGRVRAADLL